MTLAPQPQSSTPQPTVLVMNPKPVPLDPSLARLEDQANIMRDYYETGGRY
jgi:hypothetical protein